MSAGWGFRGPECLECGGTRSKVGESGYTLDGQRIRRRRCLDCDHACLSVEVYIDPALTSFHRLRADKVRTRERDYAKSGKGVFRVPSRWVVPDRIKVVTSVRVYRRVGKAYRRVDGEAA